MVGYGHSFPEQEDIPTEEYPLQGEARGPRWRHPAGARRSQLQVIDGANPVKAGSYLAISDVAPDFWTRKPDGWAMKPKNETPGATSCGHNIESAKGVVNMEVTADESLVTSQAGLPFEIVPGINPASAKPGTAIPLTVLLDGKPLRGEGVNARYAGFDKLSGSPDSKAFYGVTDTSGKQNSVPLTAGEWIVTVSYEESYPDNAACDKTDNGTLLHVTL
ncbi:MAG: DUF4198 domain-containing protein [Deltaproteobacteria bacterium]|nr:DUF4198 domain-containing protein [Deltaproteobacteria bacterium]